MNKFCVIGLGFFGEHLAKSLCEQGAEVIAIDKDTERLNAVKDYVTFAVSANSMDEKELRGLGIKDVDAAIVAIGEEFEASIVTTALLKQIGVKRVITRILNPIHEKLLRALEVSEMLVPEAEAADHLAKRLMLPGVIETFRISNDHSIFEVKIPDWMIGRSVGDVQLRQKYSLNIVTIKRKTQTYGINTKQSSDEMMVIGTPHPSQIFTDDDTLILFGKEKDFAKFIKD
ncbi:MAG: TrkA family potassium uptake protein [Ignavibacteria bacterium]|jgi:trk system potassium uptake protein TrkA|nr:TrkA family potassium uptake protein [Ignavibacteria bacterium]